LNEKRRRKTQKRGKINEEKGEFIEKRGELFKKKGEFIEFLGESLKKKGRKKQEKREDELCKNVNKQHCVAMLL